MTTWTGLACCFAAALVATAAAAETYRISPNGRSLVVRTQALQVSFDGADVASMVNLLTGETYTRKRTGEPLGLANIRMAGAGSIVPEPGGWRMSEGVNGAMYEASGKQGGRYRLHVSGEKGQLVLRCEATTDIGGVMGVGWGIGNLNLKTTSAVIPAKGGRILNSECGGAGEEIDYPSNWEAQFVIIEGKRGTVCIYSTDQQAQFKRMSYGREGSAYSLTFATENPAPFADLRAARSVEWRIACFDRDWRTAASAYVDAMRSRGPMFNPAPEPESRQWTADIRGVVRVGGDYADTVILDELARHVAPTRTLLYFHDWRRDGYDINYPDYTGRPGLARFTRHAQRLGFRVMYHVDLPGVTATHPAYERVKQHHLKDSVSLAPMGWMWDKNLPQTFAFINPASGEFRRIFVDAMRGVVEQYGPDAVHLDVSGPMWNDGNGLIEGMNYCQGSIRLHQELLDALPGLVLGGESINEMLAPYERFAQRWAWPTPLAPHPVCDFIFGRMTASYGYLGQPNPDASPSGFLQYVSVYEGQGVLPSMVVDSVDDMAAGRRGGQRWLSVIRAWQKHSLRPDWSRRWGRDTLFALKGADGVEALIERTGRGVKMTCAGSLLYERVSGVHGLKTEGHIADHLAYASGEVLCLDPERSYWLVPGAADNSRSHISAARGSLLLRSARTGPDFDCFVLDSTGERVVLDTVDQIGYARVGTVTAGAYTPLERGAHFSPGSGSVAGHHLAGLVAHPPWQPAPGTSTNPGGYTSATYTFTVPRAPEGACALHFSVGVNDVAEKTDGITFAVNIDGARAFSRHMTRGAEALPVTVDLAGYAGKTISIELVTASGPAGDTSWDHGIWGGPRVLLSQPQSRSSVEFSLTRKPISVVTGVEGSHGSLVDLRARVKNGPSVFDISRRALPCGTYFLYSTPTRVELPQDLVETPFVADLLQDGVRAPGSAWGSGNRSPSDVDGVVVASIIGHPPMNGQTVLTWLLQLPQNQARLEFTAGIRENAATGGVGFEVRVNGSRLWHTASAKPGWWPGEVDLSGYADQAVVLELVTDSMGEAFCDWAVWAAPRIVAADAGIEQAVR